MSTPLIQLKRPGQKRSPNLTLLLLASHPRTQPHNNSILMEQIQPLLTPASPRYNLRLPVTLWSMARRLTLIIFHILPLRPSTALQPTPKLPVKDGVSNPQRLVLRTQAARRTGCRWSATRPRPRREPATPSLGQVERRAGRKTCQQCRRHRCRNRRI